MRARYETTRRQFGNDILCILTDLGISQKLLAHRLGIPQKQLRQFLFTQELTFIDLVRLGVSLGGIFRPLFVLPQKPKSERVY